MRLKHLPNRREASSRRGAVIPVVAVLLPVLMIFVGFAVNIAYMELTRTELRLSCDSAAKAALVNLGATQQQSTARNFARTISANNKVGGQTLTLSDANIQFGNAVKQGNGSYSFTVGATPLNSARVTGSIAAALPLGSLVPTGTYSCSQVSFATRISHDIVLVLDRSASMAFDLSNNVFVYPPDRTMFSPLQSYFTPPSMTASRWKALDDAVDSFVAVLQARNLDAHVSLVTYAEAYSLGNYSATQASLDVQLTSNYGLIQTGMEAWGLKPLLGNTNIEAGLALAQAEVTGPRSRVTANRTIILLTDGVATSGNTDIAGLTLTNRVTSKIMTHVITFGGQSASGSAYTSMTTTAQNGNGVFYNAATASQLTQAFRKIADSLPAVLIN